ncbi:MAG: hypothetical protein Q4G16_10430 [Cruoricaptor ignavus]|nr:hypothetical protein [Cruoricaptor ignavus]
MKSLFSGIALLGCSFFFAQNQPTESQKFWDNLQKHCGKSYEGTVTAGAREGDDFTGKRLVMQVLSCETNRIRVPFYVGEDKSRTWVLTKNEQQLITLKHDHRHEDGSEDKVTQYGGQNPNYGFEKLQMFPADMETAERISYASTNLWWITLDEKTFTYNLRRVGSERVFTATFDLEKPIEFKEKPWGWSEDN